MNSYWFERLFDGEQLHEACLMQVDKHGRVLALREGAPRSAAKQAFTGLAAPGLIDMQVNGAGGVLFNATPTPAALATMSSALARTGVCHFLPTVISDALEVRLAARDALTHARPTHPELLGIHYEGPYIDAHKRGVHPATALETLAHTNDVLELRVPGINLITLAPEHVTPTQIEALTHAGFIVFMGHTQARYAEVVAARDAGARGFTHFFNAMSPLTSREGGAVGAGFALDELWLGLIVDGHHVAPHVLRMLAERRGSSRLCLVSDGMPTMAGGGTSFELCGEPIVLHEGRLTTAEGRLAGAHLPLAQAVANAVEMMGVTLHEALRMASTYPARALQLGDELGALRPGYRASVTVFDDELNVRATLVDGCPRLFDTRKAS